MHSKNSPARVLATQRRQQAVALRTEGRTYKQIGQELGVSLPRAHQLVDEAMATTRAETAANVEELRSREMVKLDALEDAIWARAAGGDLKAQEGVLRLMTRRAKLLGLDAPMKTEAKVTTTNDLAGMSDEQLLLEAERLGLHAEAAAYRMHVLVAQPDQPHNHEHEG
jgi:hypothetical protein